MAHPPPATHDPSKPAEPKRRRRSKKMPAPIPGRLEDPRQVEMFPDLPRLEEQVPDWDANWPQRDAG